METLNLTPTKAIFITPSGQIYPDYFYSHISQRMANLLPFWTKIRSDPSGSYGQQFINAAAGTPYANIETAIDDTLDNKFIATAHLDEVDHVYKSLVPATLDLSSPGIPGVKVITAPSGQLLSNQTYQFELEEVTEIGDFYFNKPPTRIQVVASGEYDDSLELSFGDYKKDPIQKRIDPTKVERDLSWQLDPTVTNRINKIDTLTRETYSSYTVIPDSYSLSGLDVKGNLLYTIANSGDNKELWILSTLTPRPEPNSLEIIAKFDISELASPSGVSVDEEGFVWVTNPAMTGLWKLKLWKDYFLLDRGERTIFFREDYQIPGIFLKPVYL